MVGLAPASIFADEARAGKETVISSFDSIGDSFIEQNFKAGITEDDISKPDTLKGKDDQGNVIDISGVVWKCSEFNGMKAGKYIFAPQMPEGYSAADGAVLPTIKVTIEKNTTTVSGLSTSIKKKAGSAIYDKISVMPAYGRTVYLQRYYSGEWHTKKIYTASNTDQAAMTLSYPKEWYSRYSTKWRVYIPETDNAEEAAINISIKAKSVYQTPGRYLKIKDVIPVRKSGYSLKTGMSGMKVYKVQKKLKCYYGRAKYTSSTKAAVKRFQKKNKLKATGRVDKATWLKMGFSENNWYYMDSYVTPKRVSLASSKKAHVNAMVATAKKYVGTKYVWCAAARPKQGVDCAGLVIQCMYSAGIDPLPQGSHVYAYSKNEYTARLLWKNKK